MADLLKILSVMFPVIFVASCGFLIAKLKLPFATNNINNIVNNWAMPSLVVSHMAAQHISFAQFYHMMLAALVAVTCMLLISAFFLKVMGLSIQAYVGGLSFSNVGNIGLPVVYFAFGSVGMSYALAFWIVVMVAIFTVGIWIQEGIFSFSKLLRTPNIYAAVIGICLISTDLTLPKYLENALSLLGGATIPLMLLTLGFSLAHLRFLNLVRGCYLSVFHLSMALALLLVLLQIFTFSPIEKGAFILEMLMPTSVYAYLLSDRYTPQYAEDVASMVMFSTLFSIVTLPIALIVVL
ncbi:AEC family transporter [Flexibacterium corallicola]|uniref:AEC family transporter n=1 Tax=Flexibacterium corallicola TaxID=3037259 RepID=UPI00286EE823|nr:AEC family transporter [Pseudovibrio sp. M1P-2-3]